MIPTRCQPRNDAKPRPQTPQPGTKDLTSGVFSSEDTSSEERPVTTIAEDWLKVEGNSNQLDTATESDLTVQDTPAPNISDEDSDEDSDDDKDCCKDSKWKDKYNELLEVVESINVLVEGIDTNRG